MRSKRTYDIERRLKQLLRENDFNDRNTQEYLELVYLLRNYGYRRLHADYLVKFEERHYSRFGCCEGE